MKNGRRGRGQEVRPEGLGRFISLLSKSKVGKARCKDRSSGGGGQRGGGGGPGGDGLQGWQGWRAGSSNSIHGCVQVGCRAGWWQVVSVVPLGLGLWLGWTVSLGCHRWSLAVVHSLLVGEAFGVPGYGRYDDPSGSGFRVLGSLGLLSAGSRSRASLVRGSAVCMQYVCSGCNTTQQFSTVHDSYGTVLVIA